MGTGITANRAGEDVRIGCSNMITRPRRGFPSRWEFISAPVTRIDSAQPLPIADRLTIFLALLIIEQHVRLVLKELYPDGRADLEATLS